MERHKESKGKSEESVNTSVAELSSTEKKERVQKAINQAKQLRKGKKYEEGIEQLVKALQLDVNKDKIYYRLGNIYFDSEDLDRAEYAYNRAIEENEDHVNAQHNLAVVYRKQGRVSKSVKQRKKAKKIEFNNPRNPDLSEEETKYAKRFAVKLICVIIGGIIGIGILIYLLSRFFF